jgi:hypothetical protein
MTNRTTARAWRVSLLCAGVAAGVAWGAPAEAVAQTDEAAQTAQTVQTVQAVQEQQQPMARASEVGHSARAWLDLQSSNTQAAPALPTLGAEAGLAYRRYMESFKSKIPDLYGSTLKGGDSNGGGMSLSGSGGAN